MNFAALVVGTCGLVAWGVSTRVCDHLYEAWRETARHVLQHAIQTRVARGVGAADLLPSIAELPEGISRDELQANYGGLGGAGTRRLLGGIDRRMAALPLYRQQACCRTPCIFLRLRAVSCEREFSSPSRNSSNRCFVGDYRKAGSKVT